MSESIYNTLPPLHKLFVDEYLVDGNASRCVRDIFGDDITETAIRVKAHRLITNDNIKQAIEERRKEISEQSILTILELDNYIYDMAKMAKDAVDFTGMNHAVTKWGQRLNAYTNTIDHKSSDKSMATITDEDQAILNRYKPQDDG